MRTNGLNNIVSNEFMGCAFMCARARAPVYTITIFMTHFSKQMVFVRKHILGSNQKKIK